MDELEWVKAKKKEDTMTMMTFLHQPLFNITLSLKRGRGRRKKKLIDSKNVTSIIMNFFSEVGW